MRISSGRAGIDVVEDLRTTRDLRMSGLLGLHDATISLSHHHHFIRIKNINNKEQQEQNNFRVSVIVMFIVMYLSHDSGFIVALAFPERLPSMAWPTCEIEEFSRKFSDATGCIDCVYTIRSLVVEESAGKTYDHLNRNDDTYRRNHSHACEKQSL